MGYKIRPVQYYYLREEIPIADELMELAPKLTEEFLNRHQDFIDGSFAKGVPYRNPYVMTRLFQSKGNAWLTDEIRYSFPAKQLKVDHTLNSENEKSKYYPTATALTKKYIDVCETSTYSIIDANSVITRHTGPEDRNNEIVRIHIPLLIPEGDVFFEIEGVEIDWTDLFAFSTQYIHSAHNYTNHRRLIYMIDIKRSFLGLPEGLPWDERREKLILPFERRKLPKMLHKHQRT
jgi:hypothetical protein